MDAKIVIRNNISLKPYNTFGLDYKAECMASIRSEDDAVFLFKRSQTLKLPLLIIGGGSNILFLSNFDGTIIRTTIKGIKIDELNDNYVIVSAGAGVEWDKLVEWTVGKGFCGLENLSLIPGTVGAAPVQNIGAYGVEVKDRIIKVTAVSTKDGSKRIFNNEECRFGYRDSVFKNEEKGKYLITNVYFRLKKFVSLNLEYGSLREEVEKLGGPGLKNTRNAVINIRKSKLPDPEFIGNAGSFFRNPVVSRVIAEDLKKEYPGIPLYDDPPDGKKLAAGWLI